MPEIDPFLWLLGIPAFFAILWPRLVRFYKIWIRVAINEHATREWPLTPEWEETHIDQLSAEQREFLGRAVLGFRAAGFDVRANLRRKTEPDGGKLKTDTWLVPMVDKRTGDCAAIEMNVNKYVRMLTLAISSEFSDGFRMTTHNSRSVGVLPSDPANHRVTFSWTQDPATLIEVHRRRVALAGRSECARKPLSPDPVIEEVNESWQREFEWLVRIGYYRRDRARNSLRPTWRGAFLVQWRLKPTIKNWLLRRRHAEARRIWEQLGMDQWTAPSPADWSAELAASDPVHEPESGPSSLEDSPASLAYQSKLDTGQIRRDRSNGVLTLRIMLPGWKRILERNVPFIFVALLFGLLTGFDIYHIWSTHRAAAWLPSRYGPFFRVDVFFFTALFLYMCLQIAKAFSRRASGTTLISVSHEGLSVSNAPGHVRNGQFSRTQVESMLVVVDQLGFDRPVFRLQARISGRRKAVVLLVGRDVRRLGSIRRELLTAMGVWSGD